jgi:phytoene dehydrogenase-like protein
VNDESTYRDRKERIAQAVIDLLEERLPGLRQGIEEIDVTTPVTTADATGNWNGATHGWLPAPGTSPFSGPKVLPQTLPGLRSFWLAGQWSSPGGGVATVAQGGRRLIQRFCQEGKRPFQARR